MNDNKPNLLTSWKEIAQYLNKGIRTVQRWAHEQGLPIRRIGENARKHSVIAAPEELDAWVRAQHFAAESDDLKAEVTKLRAALAECQRKLKRSKRLVPPEDWEQEEGQPPRWAWLPTTANRSMWSGNTSETRFSILDVNRFAKQAPESAGPPSSFLYSNLHHNRNLSSNRPSSSRTEYRYRRRDISAATNE